MTRVVSLIIFALAVLFDRIAAMTWSLCSDKGSLSPDAVLLSPDPPQTGQDIYFDIKGAYKDENIIPSGDLKVTVNFMGTPIYETEWDLCSKTNCPIAPGEIDIHYSQTLPPITPPGDYQVQLIASADSGSELLCLLVDFSIAPPDWANMANVLSSQD